jgi:hypothetical protein
MNDKQTNLEHALALMDHAADLLDAACVDADETNDYLTRLTDNARRALLYSIGRISAEIGGTTPSLFDACCNALYEIGKERIAKDKEAWPDEWAAINRQMHRTAPEGAGKWTDLDDAKAWQNYLLYSGGCVVDTITGLGPDFSDEILEQL